MIFVEFTFRKTYTFLFLKNERQGKIDVLSNIIIPKHDSNLTI